MKNAIDQYKEQRDKYLPISLRLIFILESPPTGPAYFYNEDGRVSELLFRAMMQTLFGKLPSTKKEGLDWIADAGYLIVDPIYTPVDKLPDKVADQLIAQNYEIFVKDLREAMAGKEVPLLLVKANICRLLEQRLLDDGFKVLNDGEIIPFPSHYHQRLFQEKIRSVISNRLCDLENQ